MPPLAAALPYITIASMGVSALGQMQSANSQAAMMQASARNAEIEARSIQESAKADTLKISREKRQMIGTQAAMYGAAGVDLASGSPLDVMAQTAKNYEEDLQNLGYAGDMKAAAKMYQATIYDWMAPQTRRAGMVNAMGTVIGGLGQMGRDSKYGLY